MKNSKNMILESHGQIRTVYQGDEKREEQEIGQLDAQRDAIIDEYGVGDLGRGESDE